LIVRFKFVEITRLLMFGYIDIAGAGGEKDI
jgi:hypothetical protein